MPKLKTNRSALKRFKKTASGAFKHRCAMKNHILTKKNSKRKARLAAGKMVNKSNLNSVKMLLINS